MSRRSWAELLALSALWGSSYLFIRLALDGVGPFFLVLARVGGAALLMAPLTWSRRASLAGRWPYLPLVALPQVAVPFVLISAGERQVASGIAGTLVATSPLWLVLLGPLLALGRPTLRALGGTLVGLAGVAILLGGIGTGHDVHVAGALMVVAAAMSYAIAVTLVRRWMHGVDPIALTGATMAAAGLMVLPPGLFDLPDRMPGVTPIVSLVVLAVACTAGAFIVFNRLISDVGPQRASLVAYLAPAFSVAYGALLLDEAVGLGTVAGLALILAGSWACSRGPRDREAALAAPAGDASAPYGEHEDPGQASPKLRAGQGPPG
ncbi:MAG TPA: EamA family transporter, partial [Actinopolymorphaceae bacterium]|nr:EamA family transporter [Actinopolymorphaceae bacterium]